MSSFIMDQMSLAIVRSKIFLLCGAMENEAYIRHRLYLVDGKVMALIDSWKG